jgi:hypothetical protein
MLNKFYALVGAVVVGGCFYVFWNSPAPDYVKPVGTVNFVSK